MNFRLRKTPLILKRRLERKKIPSLRMRSPRPSPHLMIVQQVVKLLNRLKMRYHQAEKIYGLN